MNSPDVVMITGAGSSVGAGMPLAIDLREQVIDRIENDSEAVIGSQVAQILRKVIELSFASENVIFRRKNPDLEVLVDILTEVASLSSYQALSGVWSNIQPYDLNTITALIVKHVAELLSKDSNPAYLANIREILSEHNPLWLFSLNHDLCFETAFEEASIPYTVGFRSDGIFDFSIFDKFASGVALYKLHGSVDWVRDTGIFYPFRRGSIEEVLSNMEEPCFGGIGCEFPESVPRRVEYHLPAIHFGGRTKFVMEYPFLHFMTRLDYALKQASIIIIMGFSLFDRHITHLIIESFYYGSKTIILVDPSPMYENLDDAATLMPFLGARPTLIETMNKQSILFNRMKYINLRGKAEDQSTWFELASIIKKTING
jgi:hypothetical protein